jgi:hypothetical protein
MPRIHPVRRDGALVLTSHLFQAAPVVPAALFVRNAGGDPLRVHEDLEQLARRAGRRRGLGPGEP